MLKKPLGAVIPPPLAQEGLRLLFVVRACYGAYFVAHVLKYLAPNFVSGRPACAALQNFCSVERGTFNRPRGLQLSTRLRNYQCTFT